MDFPCDDNVLVGLQQVDDAGVYKISDDLALIQTVDFFTPIVDDPYWFGQIAAANALSDVYAMGGIPKTAMNLVGFPSSQIDISVLRQIIKGGIDKIKEAEVVLLGGHSVDDPEMKYGLSVTGFIHPDKIITKKGLKKGDCLILTKPLGVGIVNTAIKGGLVSKEVVEKVTKIMATLNRKSAEIMQDYPVHACTDITGFGLVGHMAEMVENSELGIRVFADSLPIIQEALEWSQMGFVPAGAHKNREFRSSMVNFPFNISREIQDLVFDPQTSGGLLIGIAKARAEELLQDLKKGGCSHSSLIGEVVSDKPSYIEFV